MKLYNRLKRTRREQKIKQSYIAEAIYSRYEKGILKPDIFELCKIVDILNVSVDYLLILKEIPCLFDKFVLGKQNRLYN